MVVSLFFSILNMVLFLFFGVIARCVLETGISFGGNVRLLLQTAFPGYLIRASILASICKASVAY